MNLSPFDRLEICDPRDPRLGGDLTGRFKKWKLLLAVPVPRQGQGGRGQGGQGDGKQAED